MPRGVNEGLRPEGFRCEGDGHRSHGYLKQPVAYWCYRCKRQVWLTTGLLFLDSKLSLNTWSLAIDLLGQHKMAFRLWHYA